MKILHLVLPLASALLLFPSSSDAVTVELASNSDFESGNLDDWTVFPSGGTISVTNDSFAGTFAGNVEATGPTQNPLFKQANVGIGIVSPGDEITIRFQAKGSAADGGVHFAEFFSELDGGGVSSTEILGGGPLFPGAAWTLYTFVTTAGPDVSGGITLQLSAITGGAPASSSKLFVDNVSITVNAIPEPSSFMALAMVGIGIAVRRR